MDIEIYDNQGQSCGRYTAFINGAWFGFSENATSPQGFNQYLGDVVRGSHLGILITFDELPPEVQRAILDRAGF